MCRNCSQGDREQGSAHKMQKSADKVLGSAHNVQETFTSWHRARQRIYDDRWIRRRRRCHIHIKNAGDTKENQRIMGIVTVRNLIRTPPPPHTQWLQMRWQEETRPRIFWWNRPLYLPYTVFSVPSLIPEDVSDPPAYHSYRPQYLSPSPLPPLTSPCWPLSPLFLFTINQRVKYCELGCPKLLFEARQREKYHP